MSRIGGQQTVAMAATLLAVLSMAAMSVWDLFQPPLEVPVRGSIALGSIMLVIGTWWLTARRSAIAQARMQRFFNDLIQMPEHQLAEQSVESIIVPAQSCVDSNVLSQLAERLVSLCAQRQQIERERTRTEVRWRQAVRSQQQTQQMVESLSEPVLAINQYQEISLANERAEELFGFELESVEDRTAANLLKCEALIDLLAETGNRNTATMRTAEISLPDESGNQRWFAATASTLTSEDSLGNPGKPFGAVAILRNVGDRKAVQKRQAEFVSSVSHEMKTPLAGIKAYVELLADGDAEDEATRDEFLNVINTQADRLQRLIDNMLNLARIEAGVVEVNKQQHSLNEILEEAFRVVQPAAAAKQINLTSDLSSMFLKVYVDRDMVLQSAINLLSNAVKYTPDGGNVTLHSGEADHHVTFAVQDDGVGLSEADAAGVFEKFYRVKKDSQMASGTGLGLPLAKHIVEEVHRGELALTSELGRGSTFAVRLPKFAQQD